MSGVGILVTDDFVADLCEAIGWHKAAETMRAFDDQPAQIEDDREDLLDQITTLEEERDNMKAQRNSALLRLARTKAIVQAARAYRDAIDVATGRYGLRAESLVLLAAVDAADRTAL